MIDTGFFSGSANRDKRIASGFSGYSTEDMKNVQGVTIKRRKDPNYVPKSYELESLKRQTMPGKGLVDAGNLSVGDVKVASADIGGLSEDDNYKAYMKVQGIRYPRTLSDMFHRLNRENMRQDIKDLRFKDGQFLNKAKPTEGNILTKTGNFIANVFTPPAVAGTLEGKPTRFAGEADPTPRPKLDYVNPDKKVMTGSEIRDAFRPSNLFGINRNEIGGKLGTYDSPGSPLARDRQETMNRVATKYSSMPAPDARSLNQIREDRAAKMKTDAQQRQAAFKDTGVQTFGGKVQPQKSADDTYGTNMVSNPAFGFRSKMSEENKAKYDQSSRLATERAKTDPSLGNVITQTFNRISGLVGGPQGSLESIGERQLRAANKEINRPTYQKEAFARQALGITNQMLKDRNMQIIRQNAAARNQVFQANKRAAAVDRAARRYGSNTGSGRTGGFGTGTVGKGMPSNPKGMRQQGVGDSANNLSRHQTGHSSQQKGGPSSKKGGPSGGGPSGGGPSGGGPSGGGPSGSGPTSKKGINRSKSRRRCDIRTKIDIAPLTNQDLIRDDLANVAYFVKEIK